MNYNANECVLQCQMIVLKRGSAFIVSEINTLFSVEAITALSCVPCEGRVLDEETVFCIRYRLLSL